MMAEPHTQVDAEKLARIAKALAHHTRVAILLSLIDRCSCTPNPDGTCPAGCSCSGKCECSFSELHKGLTIAKPTMSQHLKELKEAGLITWKEEPPKVKYSINRQTWAMAHDFFNTLFRQCGNCARNQCTGCGTF